jgi:4-amino-4-deoxy-L-arabinose transferase-like glycosyltransferase
MIARWRAELAAFATLVVVYVGTLAPGVTYWDSGEFLAAMHSLGIPHPPGTPLYVLIGNLWGRALGPFLGFAYSVNLLSAVSTAGACALMANLFVRWTGDRLAAYAAAVIAGTMASVWMSSTETEVYAPALLLACLIFWICDKSENRRWLILAAFVAGLGFALHLTALLTIPAAVYLAVSRRGWREVIRAAPAMAAVLLLGASVILFMLVRASHDPFVNQGNPSTASAARIRTGPRRQRHLARMVPSGS